MCLTQTPCFKRSCKYGLLQPSEQNPHPHPQQAAARRGSTQIFAQAKSSPPAPKQLPSSNTSSDLSTASHTVNHADPSSGATRSSRAARRSTLRPKPPPTPLPATIASHTDLISSPLHRAAARRLTLGHSQARSCQSHRRSSRRLYQVEQGCPAQHPAAQGWVDPAALALQQLLEYVCWHCILHDLGHQLEPALWSLQQHLRMRGATMSAGSGMCTQQHTTGMLLLGTASAGCTEADPVRAMSMLVQHIEAREAQDDGTFTGIWFAGDSGALVAPALLHAQVHKDTAQQTLVC